MKNDDFRKQKENLQNGEGLCLFDFKQNVQLPMRAVEDSHDFFQKSQVSVLSFVCHVKNNNVVKKKTITFLSLCLNHTAEFASECLESVLKSEVFNDINKVYLWSDNGPHFHNNQFLNFIFLKNNFKNIIIEYNFFCEKHGKSEVDQFFGLMSNTLKRCSLVTPIININDLVVSLQKEFSSFKNIYIFQMFFYLIFLIFI